MGTVRKTLWRERLVVMELDQVSCLFLLTVASIYICVLQQSDSLEQVRPFSASPDSFVVTAGLSQNTWTLCLSNDDG